MGGSLIPVILIGALLGSFGTARAQAAPGIGPIGEGFPRLVPTKLGSFIAETKGVVVEKHDVGTLTGRGTARFYAVIARDPANPDAVAKGMEIDLEDGTHHDRVYPDEDSLREFARNLTRFAERKDSVVKKMQEHSHDPSVAWYSVVQDDVHVPVDSPNEWPDVPQIGLYGIDAAHELGVCIFVFRRGRDGRYYFPNADLTTVADFVAAARKWLSENH